jgi:hypothetical protein
MIRQTHNVNDLRKRKRLGTLAPLKFHATNKFVLLVLMVPSKINLINCTPDYKTITKRGIIATSPNVSHGL